MGGILAEPEKLILSSLRMNSQPLISVAVNVMLESEI
jgi:hypothetical protein